jgi:hypothetical protein
MPHQTATIATSIADAARCGNGDGMGCAKSTTAALCCSETAGAISTTGESMGFARRRSGGEW